MYYRPILQMYNVFEQFDKKSFQYQTCRKELHKIRHLYNRHQMLHPKSCLHTWTFLYLYRQHILLRFSCLNHRMKARHIQVGCTRRKLADSAALERAEHCPTHIPLQCTVCLTLMLPPVEDRIVHLSVRNCDQVPPPSILIGCLESQTDDVDQVYVKIPGGDILLQYEEIVYQGDQHIEASYRRWNLSANPFSEMGPSNLLQSSWGPFDSTIQFPWLRSYFSSPDAWNRSKHGRSSECHHCRRSKSENPRRQIEEYHQHSIVTHRH